MPCACQIQTVFFIDELVGGLKHFLFSHILEIIVPVNQPVSHESRMNFRCDDGTADCCHFRRFLDRIEATMETDKLVRYFGSTPNAPVASQLLHEVS